MSEPIPTPRVDANTYTDWLDGEEATDTAVARAFNLEGNWEDDL